MVRPEAGKAGRRSAPRWRAAAAVAVLAAAAGLTAAVGPVEAQDEERVPRIPSGVTLVVTPVQSVAPAPSGAWPGGADSRREALAAVNSEMDFAISEEPLARAWTPPGEVVEQAGRNPMLKVDPQQLAYRGLLAEDDDRPELYEPLHGQLRKLTALLDARLVALPMRVWYVEADTAAAGTEEAVGDGDARPSGRRGRAVMQIAVVDTRAGRVLWRGIVGGDPAPVDSGAALGTLASNLVRTLASS